MKELKVCTAYRQPSATLSSSAVESGEGIERQNTSGACSRWLPEVPWNPVKELKVISPRIKSVRLRLAVESGEGIERSDIEDTRVIVYPEGGIR